MGPRQQQLNDLDCLQSEEGQSQRSRIVRWASNQELLIWAEFEVKKKKDLGLWRVSVRIFQACFLLCHVWSLQSGPTLCNPMDCSPPASFVHGILQARILERVAIFFFSRSPRVRVQTGVSCTGRWILYHQATWDALSTFYDLLYI